MPYIHTRIHAIHWEPPQVGEAGGIEWQTWPLPSALPRQGRHLGLGGDWGADRVAEAAWATGGVSELLFFFSDPKINKTVSVAHKKKCLHCISKQLPLPTNTTTNNPPNNHHPPTISKWQKQTCLSKEREAQLYFWVFPVFAKTCWWFSECLRMFWVPLRISLSVTESLHMRKC